VKILDRTVKPELVIRTLREKGPTSFVGNPQHPDEKGVEFSYGGTAMLLQPGVSEVEDYLAHHVVGKFPAYRLGVFASSEAAEAHVEKVRRGE
jgi:hypothetical protein